MNAPTTPGVWRGWHWRLMAWTIAVIVVLQVAAYYFVPNHYPIVQSTLLAMLIVSYVIIPRAQERRLANAFVAIAVTFLIDLALEALIERGWQTAAATHQLLPYVELNALYLVFSFAMAFIYLRLTQWSDRKRAELEAKRRAERMKDEPVRRRVHSKKKKKKRR
ncbi:hypothetical protein [Alicyclobacillus macrosporangiidus]|uniref:Uncharacterized protein n=1 Tax=Alicyclobacillus macrosporangiidus TaxID=392015 RepID=A0A1I7JVK0_9BACL|nr:hypothetical protein [Alicyclobacillus macrosporangiidus]SFU89230.1 hypothetical protein SAMN05421543_11230 [Alicyclobacillus macrosporangiidus]